MYQLHLDLHVFFTPPMSETGPGITFTRALELPFPAHSDLMIHGKFDEIEEPEGTPLKDVIWDVDRQVFLARTTLVNVSLPMAFVPGDLGRLCECGWTLGSYRDDYSPPRKRQSQLGQEPYYLDDLDDETMEAWLKQRPRSRPKEFNQVFRAMVRTMVELWNNLPVAYAMAKTQRYFDDHERKDFESSDVRAFSEAISEYLDMPFDEQQKWRDGIMRRYPRLERFIPINSQ